VIGGPPVVQQPYAPYPYPAYVPPAYAQQPPAPRPTPRPASTLQAAARPAPVVRGQKADEPPPARPTPRPLEMPSPEALGVPVPAAELDWTDLRLRLDRVGATGFALEQVPGGYRFACRVPTAGGSPRTVEGRAATEAEAVRQALDQAGR
jgi:hypothetical protein